MQRSQSQSADNKTMRIIKKQILIILLLQFVITINYTFSKPLKNKPSKNEIEIDSLLYYKNNFRRLKKHPLADTLFAKTIWHKKVSHIVLEEVSQKIKVTLLMIMPYPYNYKSKNYAIHYEFRSYQKAFDKFTWLNKFLKKDGVLRVKIMGSKITSEKVLYNPNIK